MDKPTIRSYLQAVLGMMKDERFIEAHKELEFLMKNVEVRCNHEWEKFCSKPGCILEDCKGNRGRLCRKCKIDKEDVVQGLEVTGGEKHG